MHQRFKVSTFALLKPVARALNVLDHSGKYCSQVLILAMEPGTSHHLPQLVKIRILLLIGSVANIFQAAVQQASPGYASLG